MGKAFDYNGYVDLSALRDPLKLQVQAVMEQFAAMPEGRAKLVEMRQLHGKKMPFFEGRHTEYDVGRGDITIGLESLVKARVQVDGRKQEMTLNAAIFHELFHAADKALHQAYREGRELTEEARENFEISAREFEGRLTGKYFGQKLRDVSNKTDQRGSCALEIYTHITHNRDQLLPIAKPEGGYATDILAGYQKSYEAIKKMEGLGVCDSLSELEVPTIAVRSEGKQR